MEKESKIIITHWKTISRYPDFAWIKKLILRYPGIEIYLVGGAIRDILLKRGDIIDYDFVVRNLSSKRLGSFLNTLGTVNLVGKTFGVYKYVAPKAKLKEVIDIALPRTEVADRGSGAHRDVAIETDPLLSIHEDLSRRDFTINAMAWNVITNELIDPFKGKGDIAKKILNTVGFPQRRFTEDLARILRGVRFSVTLSFKLHKRVKKRIIELAPLLNKKTTSDNESDWVVPREVIAKELIKTFIANPSKAFELYDKLGLIKVLLPELLPMKKCPQPKAYHTEGDVWQHTKLALSKIGDNQFKKFFPGENVTPLLIFATLFHDIGKPSTLQTPKNDSVDRVRNNNHDHVGGKMVTEICKRLKLSSFGDSAITCDSLSWLVKKHLLLVHGPISNIKNNTLEKYFFNNNVPGVVLRQLFYTDGAATIPKDGNNLNALKSLLKRLQKIQPIIQTKQKMKKKGLLSGNDLIKNLGLKQGLLIGELLVKIREAELSGTITTKKEALALAKKIIKK